MQWVEVKVNQNMSCIEDSEERNLPVEECSVLGISSVEMVKSVEMVPT